MMAVIAIGAGSGASADELRIACHYAREAAGPHDLVVGYDENKIRRLTSDFTEAEITRAWDAPECPNAFFNWSRLNCDVAERTILVTAAPFATVYPQGGTSPDLKLQPYCATALALVPRRGRVMWTDDEVAHAFLGRGVHADVFQRIEILDHSGNVAATIDNTRVCSAFDARAATISEFRLPDPDGDLSTASRSQIPLSQSR